MDNENENQFGYILNQIPTLKCTFCKTDYPVTAIIKHTISCMKKFEKVMLFSHECCCEVVQ